MRPDNTNKMTLLRRAQRARDTSDWLEHTPEQVCEDVRRLTRVITTFDLWLPDALDTWFMDGPNWDSTLRNVDELVEYRDKRSVGLREHPDYVPSPETLPGFTASMDLNAFVRLLERHHPPRLWSRYPRAVTYAERCLEHLWRAQRYTETANGSVLLT